VAQGGKAAATAAVAVEGVSPLTAGGKRKLGELGKLGEAGGAKLAPPAVVVAARPEKKQLGLMAFFSKKVA